MRMLPQVRPPTVVVRLAAAVLAAAGAGASGARWGGWVPRCRLRPPPPSRMCLIWEKVFNRCCKRWQMPPMKKTVGRKCGALYRPPTPPRRCRQIKRPGGGRSWHASPRRTKRMWRHLSNHSRHSRGRQHTRRRQPQQAQRGRRQLALPRRSTACGGGAPTWLRKWRRQRSLWGGSWQRRCRMHSQRWRQHLGE